MRKLLLVCVALLLGLAVPAAADDAALLNEAATGKDIVLVPAELPVPGEDFDGAPISLSPDGQTMLWRGLGLTRNGELIPVHAAPERGAGDPYGELEKELYKLARDYPGEEGVAWSPDGKYIVLTDKRAANNMSTVLDLVLLDTETGEAFLEQAYNHKSKNRLKSEDFGVIFEARFDSTGQYIYMIARINAYSKNGYSLYRYSLADGGTELLLEDIGMVSQGRSLYEDSDGSWLLIASSDRGSKTTQDVYIRYRPGEGVLRTDERGVLSSGLRGGETAYSAASGYGLILCESPTASNASNARASDVSETVVLSRYQILSRCLNRITPEGIDLEHYWKLYGDAYDPSTVRAVEVDRDMVDILNRLVREEACTEEEQDALSEYSRNSLRDSSPKVSCFCLSPDGRCALLSTLAYGGTIVNYFLLDIESMSLYPVAFPTGMGPAYYSTPYSGRFRPGMVWEENGVLLINSKNAFQAYRLEGRDPASRQP